MKHNAFCEAYENIKTTPTFKQRVFNRLDPSEKANAQKDSRIRFTRIAAAVCVCLCVLIGTIWTTVAEAEEYHQAVAYFEENGLPLDGLNRNDIKEVYKDIVMGTFSYEKTADVFSTISLKMHIETLGPSPDKSELEALWQQWQAEEAATPDCHYKVEGVYDSEENLVGTVVTKIENGCEVWRYTDNEWGYVEGGFIVTDKGIYVYGTETRQSLWSGRVMLLSRDGKLIWKKQCANDQGWVKFDHAISEEGDIVIFGSKDVRNDDNSIVERYVTVQKYNAVGELIWYKENPTDSYFETRVAVSLGDGYLIKLCEYDGDGKLIAVSNTGAFNEEYSYTIDGKQYIVQDIIACGEKVYLSCMAMNMSQCEFEEAFNNLCEERFELCINTGPDVVDMPENYTQRLTSLFQTQYTAALFSSNKQGCVTNVQIVENARAGALSAENGVLSQQIFRIDAVKNGPLHISSFRVLLYGTEFAFLFDADDQLIEKNEFGLYGSRY